MLNSDTNQALNEPVKIAEDLELMLNDVLKHGAFTGKDIFICSQIMIGCCDLVNDLEKQWYGKNSKSTKLSEKDQAELIMIFRFDSNFSLRDVRNTIANNEQSIFKRNLFRATNSLTNVGFLKKTHLTQYSKRHGRPREVPDELTARKSYGQSERVTFLKTYVNDLAPRYFICLQLHHCGLIERYLTLHHFILMMILKNEGIMERLKLDRTLGIIGEGSNDEYSKEYPRLVEMDKKQVLAYARNKAKQTLHQITWRSSYYTTFFMVGALRYEVIMTNPLL